MKAKKGEMVGTRLVSRPCPRIDHVYFSNGCSKERIHGCADVLRDSGPYSKYDPQKVHNSLTAGTLRGPGKLAVAPLLWAKKDETEAVGEIAINMKCGSLGPG